MDNDRSKKTNINKRKILTSYQYEGNINLNELKKIFINSSIFLNMDIGKKLKNIREREAIMAKN